VRPRGPIEYWCTDGAAEVKRKRPGIVSRADGLTLRRIAHNRGILVTYVNGSAIFTLRASGERVRPEVVQRLINRRVLIAENGGLLFDAPQSYRTRVPADGKL